MSDPMKVFCRDGEAGWLKEIIIDQVSGRPFKLRIELLNDTATDMLIDIILVTDIVSEEIRLKVSMEELDVLRKSRKKEREVEPDQRGAHPATFIY